MTLDQILEALADHGEPLLALEIDGWQCRLWVQSAPDWEGDWLYETEQHDSATEAAQDCLNRLRADRMKEEL